MANNDRIINNEQGNALISLLSGISSAVKNKTFLQNKTVKSTGSQYQIESDEDYVGLNQITVEPIRLESKSVTPSRYQQYVTPSSDYYDGLSYVSVEGAPLQSKVVTPSNQEQVITPDQGYLGFYQIIVEKGGSASMSTKMTLSPTSWTGSSAPYRYDLGSSFANMNVIVGINENELDETQLELIGKFMIVGGESGRYLYALQWHPSIAIPVVIQYTEESS